MQAARDQSFTRALCLYHYPCHDGAFAALAAHIFHKQVGLAAQFIPNRVFAPVSVEELHLDGREVVYLLDFAGPAGFAKEVSRRAQRTVVIDHHKTSAAELSELGVAAVQGLEVNFDMTASGATLALAYFKPQARMGHRCD